MGDFFKSIFGGSKQESVSIPKDVTPPELAALRQPFANVLTNLFGQQGGSPIGGVPAFSATSPLVAPAGASENTILQNLMAQLGVRQPILGQTLAGEFLPGGTQGNPFLQATIEAAQRPTFEGLEEVLSRTLPGRFTQAGQFVQPGGTSAFDRAAAIASRGAAQAASDIATNITFGTQEAERTRQQQAVQLSQQEVETTITNLAAQALPRLIQDLGIERGQAEFQNRIQALLQALAVTTGAPLSQVATEQRQTGESTPGVLGALGNIFRFSGSI